MKKREKIALALGLILALIPGSLSSCGKKAAYLSDSFFALDTVITVSLDAEVGESETIFAGLRSEVSAYDTIFSAFLPESELARFNAGSGSFAASEELRNLISAARRGAEETGGAFDPTLFQVKRLWAAAEEKGSLPDEAELASALALRGWEKLGFSPDGGIFKGDGQMIDPGGVAKGWITERLLKTLEAADGIRYAVVSVGGNVGVFGEKPDGQPFEVAIRDPADPARVLGTVRVPGGSIVSVSGNYERYYEIGGQRYGHILDPGTGMPADSGLLSTVVICSDGARADVLSTALFVLGAEKGMELWREAEIPFEAIFISDGTASVTPGLEDRVELTGAYRLASAG